MPENRLKARKAAPHLEKKESGKRRMRLPCMQEG
jgi:hypothetical protein